MNINKLKQEQLRLAKKVEIRDSFSNIDTIAGCDIAYTFDKLISSIVVLDFKTLEIIEKRVSVSKVKFPRVSSFLSYREAPSIINLFAQLKNKPDLLMCNSNGILHPRRMGAASHIGLSLDIPTIGVANELLCGTIKDKRVFVEDEPRGYELKTKEHANPIYISPGHKVSRRTSLKITIKCLKENKLPEPLRLAHKAAVTKRRELKESIKVIA